MAFGWLHSRWRAWKALQAVVPVRTSRLEVRAAIQHGRSSTALRVESSTRKFCGQEVKRAVFRIGTSEGFAPKKGGKPVRNRDGSPKNVYKNSSLQHDRQLRPRGSWLRILPGAPQIKDLGHLRGGLFLPRRDLVTTFRLSPRLEGRTVDRHTDASARSTDGHIAEPFLGKPSRPPPATRATVFHPAHATKPGCGGDRGIGSRVPNRPWRLLRPTWRPPPPVTSTSRTARCGPACRVVWEGTGQGS